MSAKNATFLGDLDKLIESLDHIETYGLERMLEGVKETLDAKKVVEKNSPRPIIHANIHAFYDEFVSARQAMINMQQIRDFLFLEQLEQKRNPKDLSQAILNIFVTRKINGTNARREVNEFLDLHQQELEGIFSEHTGKQLKPSIALEREQRKKAEGQGVTFFD